MRNAHLAAAALLALAAVPATAVSTVSVSVSIDHLGYTLIDNDPLDGISPGILFYNLPFGYAGASAGTAYQHQANDVASPGPFASLATQATLPNGLAHASLAVTGNTGAAGWGDLSMTASGSADFVVPGLGGSSFGGQAGVRADASAAPLHFVLTPHTEVVFSATSTLNAQVLGDWPAPTLPVDLGAFQAVRTVEGLAVVEVFDASGTLQQTSINFDNRYLTADYIPHYGYMVWPAGGARVGGSPLSVSYRNDTDQPLAGGVDAFVRIAGSQSTSTPLVPEPSDWAMLVAGGAVMGLLARRRRR